jgi:hypothetical protein
MRNQEDKQAKYLYFFMSLYVIQQIRRVYKQRCDVSRKRSISFVDVERLSLSMGTNITFK